MASLAQWTWVWASSCDRRRPVEPGMPRSMESRRAGHTWATEQQPPCRQAWAWAGTDRKAAPIPILTARNGLPTNSRSDYERPVLYSRNGITRGIKSEKENVANEMNLANITLGTTNARENQLWFNFCKVQKREKKLQWLKNTQLCIKRKKQKQVSH